MQGASKSDYPQSDGFQKAGVGDGLNDLVEQGNHGVVNATDMGYNIGNDAAENLKVQGHQLHAVDHGGLGGRKADEVAEHVFRALEVPETRRRAKNGNGGEQDKQAVADGYQPAVDLHHDVPHAASLEGFG